MSPWRSGRGEGSWSRGTVEAISISIYQSINLSVVAEGGGLVVDKFDERFNEQLSFDLKTVLRDVQSRGYGGVVRLLKDNKSRFDPI